MTTKTREKTLARERMKRTGERYTTALAAIRRELSARSPAALSDSTSPSTTMEGVDSSSEIKR
ncbi:hypothetical protein F0U59_23505 [Archangium gephyra]|nr:hypothetical protein F0U59_23505 [Archangium gephyra]